MSEAIQVQTVARAARRDQVRRILVELLPSGVATVDAVAARMCMSKRNLQRRLRDEDTTFALVLASLRLDLSRHYLRRTALSVSQIGAQLGYRDLSAFSKAFKSWEGVAPDYYRRACCDHVS